MKTNPDPDPDEYLYIDEPEEVPPPPPICGKCKTPLVGDSYWERHHLWGKIALGYPSQIHARLANARNIAEDHHNRWANNGHPAIEKLWGQEVIFAWPKPQWVLCQDCQKELIELIGRFFEIPQDTLLCQQLPIEHKYILQAPIIPPINIKKKPS